MKVAVVIPAAGSSRRFNGGNIFGSRLEQKKPFATLKGRAVWLYSVERFARRNDVVQIVLVVAPEDVEEVEAKYRAEIALYGVEVVAGGAERFLSIENALKVVRDDVDLIAVHDAARPCVDSRDIEKVFAEAERSGAAILASPVVGSLKRSKKSEAAPNDASEEALLADFLGGKEKEERLVVASSASREDLWEAQTPQAFARELLLRAYRERPKDFAPTDDCGLVEALGREVAIVSCPRTNIKITSADDLAIAEKFLELVERRAAKPSRFF